VLGDQRDEIYLRRQHMFDSADLSGWFIDLATRVATTESDVAAAYFSRRARVGGATMQKVVRYIGLTAIDYHWREHLQEMDALLSGIGLRAIGGRSPLAEYRRDAMELFMTMISAAERMTVDQVFANTPAVPAWLKARMKE
jgi:preprotein translocase subunit SecA